MLLLESSLRNYTLSHSSVDLEAAMVRLAVLAQARYAERGYEPRKKVKTLKAVFAERLNIGAWPGVLQGTYNENFKVKADAFLAKVRNDVHKAATLMAKQVCDIVDQVANQ